MKIRSIISIAILCLYSGLMAQNDPQIMSFDWKNAKWEAGTMGDKDTTSARVIRSEYVIEYHYDDNGQLERYFLFYEKIKINNNVGLERYNTLEVYPGYDEEIPVFKARYIGKDGKTREFSKSDLKKIDKENENSYHVLAFDGAEVGGIIEYFWAKKSYTNLYGSFVLQKTSAPQDSCTFSLITPINLRFRSKSYNGFPNLQETIDSTLKIRTKKAAVANMPRLEKESQSYINKYLQRVEYNIEYNTYNATKFGSSTQNIYANTASFTNKEKKTLSTLWKKMRITDRMDEETKIRIVEDYIKQNIKPINGYVKGMDLSDFKDIMSSNYANENGYLRLISASLQHFDIPYELVCTCDKTEKAFDKDFEGDNFLDNFLFYFPNIDQYLDPSNVYNRLGVINSDFVGNEGLFLKTTTMGGISTFMPYSKTIPTNDYKKTVHETNSNISIDVKKMTADYTIKTILTGYTGTYYQPAFYYSTDKNKEELAKSMVLETQSKDKMTSWKVENPDPIDWYVKPLTITTTISGGALLTRGGNDILLQIGQLIGRQQEMYQKTERKLPIENDYARSYSREIVLTIPDGYFITNPDDINMKKELKMDGQIKAQFSSSYKIEGNKLTINSSEYYIDIFYPAERYKEYVTVINAAADFNKLTLILSPKK
ncbi:MAG: DUF3857 domain-containing protein [Paludibacteraceae bacterium]|nr:DUF3857 domain-containing protein [Prevotellaceae bacterium]